MLLLLFIIIIIQLSQGDYAIASVVDLSVSRITQKVTEEFSLRE